MNLFRFVMVAAPAALLFLTINANAGKTTASIARLSKQIEEQKEEIELLKMRLELLEAVVKPGQQDSAAQTGGPQIISPRNITYP
jgi:hypothetical protein